MDFSYACDMALKTATSVYGRHFGSDWNVSTTIRWNAMNFASSSLVPYEPLLHSMCN